MNQEKTETRKIKGMEIAKTSRITRNEKGEWKVPSQSGGGFYIVVSNGMETKCDCPDHELRNSKCKHIWAVEMIVTKEVDKEGNVTIKAERKTYPQDWKNYNLAQEKEKSIFMKLLADVTHRIRQPSYSFGRPEKQLGDTIYSMVFKVYSTVSSRRFTSDMEMAKGQGLIEQITPRSSMSDYFNKKEITSLLSQIVTVTSLPLTTIEKDFAIDSTGFGTSLFQRWYSFKHGKEISSRRWVKCHFMTGLKSNIVTSVKVTSEFDNDCPQLPELVKATAENFDMEQVSCDKAYLSRENMMTIQENGATPYIPFKSNSTGKSRGAMIWNKMYHYYMMNRDEFLESYHKRSNAESSVFMIKSKFGDAVRSKEWTAQVNEVLCKVICHNIYCVIQEMFILNIKPDFVREVIEVSENSGFSAT